MRSAVEWSRPGALAADGVSQREIAARLGSNRQTVGQFMAAESRRYSRSSTRSMRDLPAGDPAAARRLAGDPGAASRGEPRDGYGYAGGGGSGQAPLGHVARDLVVPIGADAIELAERPEAPRRPEAGLVIGEPRPRLRPPRGVAGVRPWRERRSARAAERTWRSTRSGHRRGVRSLSAGCRRRIRAERRPATRTRERGLPQTTPPSCRS